MVLSKCLFGVRRKGVQAPLCVQDVKSRITRVVVVCVGNYHHVLCVTAVVLQPKKPI